MSDNATPEPPFKGLMKSGKYGIDRSHHGIDFVLF